MTLTLTLLAIAFAIGYGVAWAIHSPTKELNTPKGTPHILPPHERL